MLVRDGMSKVVLSVGPGHTLRQAAELMARRKVGAAVVVDPDGEGPGILTERDILESVARGQDPDAQGPGIITERDLLLSIGRGEDPDEECVSDHLSAHLTFAAPDWSLEEAAVAMVRGGFRHLVVIDRGETAGVLSVRDVVRCWTDDGAICDVPESAGFGATAA